MKKSMIVILTLLVCVALAPMAVAFNPQPEPPGKPQEKYFSYTYLRPGEAQGSNPPPKPQKYSYTPSAALVVRSTKPADTTQPGMGRYLDLYYAGSTEPGSPKYYLGSTSVIQFRSFDARQAAARALRISASERAYQALIARREARRIARVSQKPKYYQWGVSAPPPLRVQGGLQPAPQTGGPAPSTPPEGMPNTY